MGAMACLLKNEPASYAVLLLVNPLCGVVVGKPSLLGECGGIV